ncbi:unnamed protein product, partial [Chrysoparadoxa australica]
KCQVGVGVGNKEESHAVLPDPGSFPGSLGEKCTQSGGMAAILYTFRGSLMQRRYCNAVICRSLSLYTRRQTPGGRSVR